MMFDFKRPAIVIAGMVATALALIVWNAPVRAASDGNATITMPKLSMKAAAGKVAYDKNCAQCHGENTIGTDKGPTFIHRVYNPGHHGDGAFVRAAKKGTRQHHWPFGDMPLQPQVSDREIERIILYVREMQRANGIGSP